MPRMMGGMMGMGMMGGMMGRGMMSHQSALNHAMQYSSMSMMGMGMMGGMRGGGMIGVGMMSTGSQFQAPASVAAANRANGAVMRDNGFAKTTHDMDYTLKDMVQGHYAKHNPNNNLYTFGDQRQSSEGLYQDRYNVGYHSDDDKGDPYASNSFMGSTKGYFDNYNAGKDNFLHAYKNYVGLERDEGYAGDVLKLIDQGRIKNVDDDTYNMIVTDAKNYDWDERNKIAGLDAHGGGSYDSRIGGRSQKSFESAGGSGQMLNTQFAANTSATSQQIEPMESYAATYNPGIDLMTNQGYQRKYSLEAPEFLKQYTGKLLG